MPWNAVSQEGTILTRSTKQLTIYLMLLAGIRKHMRFLLPPQLEEDIIPESFLLHTQNA